MLTKKNSLYNRVALLVLIFVTIISLLPLVLLVVASFTDAAVLVKDGYCFWPEKWSVEAYQYLWLSRKTIFKAYGMSFGVTFLGTALSLAFTSMLAYTLSKNDLPGRKIPSFLVFFTMLFNGGLVPTYLLYTNYLHINDTLLALLIPNLLVRAYYVFLMRSYYKSIPDEVVEAAAIDGANEILCFSRVVLPMAKPIVATVALFTFIGYWNDWQNGLYYLTKRTDLYTIQNLLNRMISEIQYLSSSALPGASVNLSNFPSVSARMAIAVIGVLPVIILYPFVRKNFVSGIMAGSVKG